MSVESEIKNLESLLKYHDDLYYLHDSPTISDEEYNSIKKKYLTLTNKVEYDYVPGETSLDLTSMNHSHSIKSLEKVNTEEELRSAIKRLLPIVVQPKFDGLTVVMYPGEHPYQPIFATRGNGQVGEIITHTAERIIGLRNAHPLREPIRMEAYIPLNVFENLNRAREANGEKPFKNPRNAAAGMLRHKDAEKVRGVQYFAYNLVGSNLAESEQIRILQSLDYHAAPTWNFSNEDEAVDFIMNFDRSSLNYEIDGLVIKSNIPCSLMTFGETGHHPKNAVAYKFPAKGEWTKLNDITWQVGRTGKITPVAEIQPVDIGGSTISRVTLHNKGIMDSIGIQRHCDVFVIKANDVIPAIIETRQLDIISPVKTGSYDEPASCPICNGITVRDNDQLFCTNATCKAKSVGRLVHMAGREALDIEGLSDETAEKLFESGLIEYPEQIFNLTIDSLLTLEGFAKKKAENLVAAIQARRNVDFKRFLIAAGMPCIGKSTSEDIANHFGSFEEWMSDADNAFEKTRKINGIGEETINSLYENGYILADLIEYINPIPVAKLAKPDTILTFVITGTLEKPRSYYENLVKTAGHKISGSVSKKTSFCLVGEEAGSKLTKAQELGVSIITTEEELRELL